MVRTGNRKAAPPRRGITPRENTVHNYRLRSQVRSGVLSLRLSGGRIPVKYTASFCRSNQVGEPSYRNRVVAPQDEMEVHPPHGNPILSISPSNVARRPPLAVVCRREGSRGRTATNSVPDVIQSRFPLNATLTLPSCPLSQTLIQSRCRLPVL